MWTGAGGSLCRGHSLRKFQRTNVRVDRHDISKPYCNIFCQYYEVLVLFMLLHPAVPMKLGVLLCIPNTFFPIPFTIQIA